MRPIADIAADLGLAPEDIVPFGRSKAKVRLDALERLARRPQGKLVVVTAVTPTPLGEGKTVTTIGLSMALRRIGLRAACTVRQPSMGPIFGVKGSAVGGGAATLQPADEISLHLTGDMHAVTAAHNLLAACLDNAIYHRTLPIDPATIAWRRVLDVNDRALRSIRLSERHAGAARETGFDITPASEVMAILALARSYSDLRQRLGRIIVAARTDGAPVTAEDLRCAGAMAAVLRDALLPNLLQTSEGTPAFVHTGPFGNIAHGNSSVLADLIALRACDIVVTESGFGADLGFEKFADIKCPAAGLRPSAAVIVATARALKIHSGRFRIRPGRPLPVELRRPDPGLVRAGGDNLRHMISIVRSTGIPAVVAINRFPDDAQDEIESVARIAEEEGAAAAVSEVFARGGEGGTELARHVAEACERASDFRPIVAPGAPVRDKIETLARVCYRAGGVDYAPEAQQALERYERWGFGRLAVCMAKTQLSVSHDPERPGAPSGYRFPIRDVRLSAGAGFVVPLAGAILTMPGLPAEPAAARIELEPDGTIRGIP
jgi:formate--tetrahydrofolate ligase